MHLATNSVQLATVKLKKAKEKERREGDVKKGGREGREVKKEGEREGWR